MRQFKNTKNITERNNISVNNYLKEVSQIREKALCKIRRSNKIGILAQYIG